jgi:hypothetical protein
VPRVPEIRNVHTYQPDPYMAPTYGDAPCSMCGFPKPSRVHDVPEPDPEAAVIDARILGETQEQQREGDHPS